MNIYQDSLKIFTLSGTESVTKNMSFYECGDDIIVVDCGIGFPDSEMPGVDVVIPDVSYLLKNSHKVRGIFITHAHEDHIGALPYVLKDLNVPIYTNKLVWGFIKDRLDGNGNRKFSESVSFHLFSPETSEVTVGNFKVSAFRVNHSVPASMGFAISTPQGLIVHVADFKIDWTPVLDKPIDLAKIAGFGEKGVLCLLSDCLGSTTDGYSKSESSLNDTFNDLFENAGGRQVFVTTISSNISRMHQIITSAIKHGRKVVLSGRSIEQSVEVARSLGYLQFDKLMFVSEEKAKSYQQKDLVYVIAGCYGQSGSSLGRLSRNEHKSLKLEKSAMVIFSADPNPPGVAEAVERVMDNLTLSGAEVIYSKIQENLHVSGHGSRGDLMTLASVVKPKYFIPLGGTVTRMRAYSNMIESLGYERERVFELLEGESVVFDGGVGKRGERLQVQQIFVDGTNVGDVGPVVIKDRELLSSDGVFVIVVPISKDKTTVSGNVEIITRGFVYVKESKALIGKASDVINKVLEKNKDKLSDWNFTRSRVEKEIEKFLYKETGRRPLVIVSSLVI